MKFEVEINTDLLQDQAQEIAKHAARVHLRGDGYNASLTSAGKEIAQLAHLKAAEFLASSPIREMIRATVVENMEVEIKEITTAELRKAIRAELKRLRENGELKLENQ